jgi:stage V sporulation protein B
MASAEPKDRRGVILGGILYSLIFGVLASVLLFLLSDVISWNILSEPRAALPLRLLSASLIFVALGSAFNGYFVGVKRVSSNAAVQIFGQGAKVIFSVFLVLAFGKGDVYTSVILLAFGMTVTEVLAFVMILILYLADKKKYGDWSKASPAIGQISKMALPLAFSQYFRSLLLSAEHILIPRRLMDRGESNSEALSNYGILHGMALPTVLFPMSPLSSYSGLLVPEFAEDEAKGNKERMSKITTEALNTTLKYATVVSVLVAFFAEELGYVLYDSFDSGYYIRLLAPVIPIMYLDHVTDQILKGIGEHVYSMWVNIADSCLSLLLVYFLIPRMGIMGYALVIVIMEGFNFVLSIVRLAGKIKLRVNILGAVVTPAAAALIACFVCGSIFRFNGAASSLLWVAMKLIFAISVFVFLYSFRKVVLCNIYKKKKIPKNN